MNGNTDLVQRCNLGEEVCSNFLRWSDNYPNIVGQDSHTIVQRFNKYARQFERLGVAAKRPMGVAVFGPSQAGKSYLISALAREGTKPLLAKFGNRSVDFISDINPGGDTESTGIVTRFTVKQIRSPFPDAPVVLRLLTELDVIKILTNSFFSDVDPGAEHPLSATIDQLEEALSQAEHQIQEHDQGSLKKRDIYDFRNYLTRYFRGFARLANFDDLIWERLVELLPKLPTNPRAELLSLFWGGHSAFTNLYIRLFEDLKSLNFAQQAYCALETTNEVQGALLPRNESVIDVATLGALGADESSVILVKADGGSTVSMRRCDLTALIAELVIEMEDQPYDYFDYTDLLDFPGYRARDEISDVEKFLSKEDGLKNFYLRGKVDYLYRRYREDRDLTSMILCVGPSNQEANALPEAVFEWISDTHGETPEQRKGKTVSLFLALTKFDMAFNSKQGMGSNEGDYVEVWETRLFASVWGFLGKQHEWVENWDGMKPFSNIFWIRNPNYQAEHIFQYDDKGLEIGLVESPRVRERIGKLKSGFIGNPKVTRHFEDADLAFEEALKENEGGINYLASQLGKICDPYLKSSQLSDQVDRLYTEMRDFMSPYFVSDDQTELLKKRVEDSKVVVRELAQCAEKQRFGNFLRELQFSEDDASRIYYHLYREGVEENGRDEKRVDGNMMTSSSSILDDILDDSSDQTESTTREVSVSSFAIAYAEAVVSQWLTQLDEFAEDQSALGFYFLNSQVYQDLVRELGAGLSRVDLKHAISRVVDETEHKRMTVHDAVRLPAKYATHVVNDFINYLNFDKVPLNDRPNLNGRPVFEPKPHISEKPKLSAIPQAYELNYTREWLKAYLEFVVHNATIDPSGTNTQGGHGMFDTKANDELGGLLSSLAF